MLSFRPYLDLKVQTVNLVSYSKELAQSYLQLHLHSYHATFLHTNCTETQTAFKHAIAFICFSSVWFPQTQNVSRQPLFYQNQVPKLHKKRSSGTTRAAELHNFSPHFLQCVPPSLSLLMVLAKSVYHFQRSTRCLGVSHHSDG